MTLYNVLAITYEVNRRNVKMNEVALNTNVLESVVVGGDLAGLSPTDRVMYYTKVCESLGLNPLTKPFEYMKLQGKMTLYARKDCTEQLRNLRGISISITARELVEDCYLVTARATNAQGRSDEAIGAVSIQGLKGEARANAIMKAETKAKRRVTLSIAGLGMLDEHEVETIPGVVIGEQQLVAEHPMSEETLKVLLGFMAAHETSEEIIKKWCSQNKVSQLKLISEVYAQKLIKKFQEREEQLLTLEEEQHQQDQRDVYNL